MSKTTLSAETLAELHVLKVVACLDRARPFVDPYVIARCERLLAERGEDWAASVLLRPLQRRSLLRPRLPWLETGEPEILVLADEAEWSQLTQAARP